MDFTIKATSDGRIILPGGSDIPATFEGIRIGEEVKSATESYLLPGVVIAIGYLYRWGPRAVLIEQRGPGRENGKQAVIVEGDIQPLGLAGHII